MRKPLRILVVSSLAAVLIAVMGLPAASLVTFNRARRTLLHFTLDSGKGKVTCHRKEWNNTDLVTETSKTIRVVDPFMYYYRVQTADGKTYGGYWNRPEIWDTWKVREVKLKYRPNTDIVWIAASPKASGIKKEVTISVEKGQNIAYVFNRLIATEDITLQNDRQGIYFYNPATLKTYVDDKQITPKNGVSVPV